MTTTTWTAAPTKTSVTRRLMGSPRSPSAGPRSATPFVPRRCSIWRAPSSDARNDPTSASIILTGSGTEAFCSGGDQRSAARTVTSGSAGERCRTPQRARPADPDAAPAQADRGDGRRLRHRRRPHPASGVRPDDRRRQRALRAGGPPGGSFDAGYGSGLLARTVGPRRRPPRSGSCAANTTPSRRSTWGS